MKRRSSSDLKKPVESAKSNKDPQPIGEDVSADVGLMLKATSGSLDALIRAAVPSGLSEQLELAEKYADGECDLVQDIVNTKSDFYAAGCCIQVKPENQTNKKKMDERVEDFLRDFNIYKIAAELIRDYVATDNAILQWAMDGSKVGYVNTLRPSRVQFGSLFGKEFLKVKIAEYTYKQIKQAINANNKDALATYPKKYVDAVRAGQNFVELKNEDGEYWIVSTRGRMFSGLTRPSMYSRFTDIILREVIRSGDWAIAHFLKRVIEHVKTGEMLPGNNIDPKALYATDEDFKNLKKAFGAIGQALRLYTNHTVKVEYPHPDPEIFDPIKYTKVEERIVRWGGVPDVLMTGIGEGFSQGHLGVRRFVANGKHTREVVSVMLGGFLQHETISGALKIPTGSDVSTTWDEQNLKDPEQVLKEVQLAQDSGGMDMQTMHERLGMNHERIKAGKEQDQKEKALWQPTFEPSQGMLTLNKKGGRPTEPGPANAPSSRPKPSKKGG